MASSRNTNFSEKEKSLLVAIVVEKYKNVVEYKKQTTRTMYGKKKFGNKLKRSLIQHPISHAITHNSKI